MLINQLINHNNILIIIYNEYRYTHLIIKLIFKFPNKY